MPASDIRVDSKRRVLPHQGRFICIRVMLRCTLWIRLQGMREGRLSAHV